MPLGAFNLNGLGKTQVSSSVTYTVKNTLTGIDRTADNAFGHYNCGYLGDDSSQNPCFAMAYKDNSDGIVKVVAFMVSKTTGALTIGTPASSALVGQDPYLKTENQDAQLRKTSSWSAAGVFSFYYNTAARLRIGAFTVNLSTLAVTIGALVQETTQTGAGVSVITYVDNNRFVVTHRGNVGQYRVSELFSRSGTTLTSVVSANNTTQTGGGFMYETCGFVYNSATPMYRFAYSGVGNNYAGSEYTTAKFDNTTLRHSNYYDFFTDLNETNSQNWMLNLDTTSKGLIVSQENNLNVVRATAIDISWNASGTNPSETLGNTTRTPRTITANGNAQMTTADGKFSTPSAIFDGTGDWLDIGDITGVLPNTNNFTLEFWVLFAALPTASNFSMIWGTTSGNQYFGLWNSAGSYRIAIAVQGTDGTFYSDWATTAAINTWYHYAFVKNGATLAVYRDGTALTSPATSGTMTSLKGISGTTTYIGRWSNATTYQLNGKLDEIRLSSSVRYTGNFTVATAEFVNDSNTVLLLHCNGNNSTTNFRDDAYDGGTVLNQVRTPKTVTALYNARVSTAQNKFGGASLLLDGSGDALIASPTTDMVWGTGSDFTYECWVRFSSTAATYIFDQRTAFGTAAVALLYDSTALDYYQGGTRRINYVWTPTLNTWYHVAICRGSGTTRLFVDGVQRGSFSDTLNYVQGNSNLYIGGWWNNSSTASGFNGYIDEVRISNSARYTSGFTPSAAAFTNDANTILLLHCNGANLTTRFLDDAFDYSPLGVGPGQADNEVLYFYDDSGTLKYKKITASGTSLSLGTETSTGLSISSNTGTTKWEIAKSASGDYVVGVLDNTGSADPDIVVLKLT